MALEAPLALRLYLLRSVGLRRFSEGLAADASSVIGTTKITELVSVAFARLRGLRRSPSNVRALADLLLEVGEVRGGQLTEAFGVVRSGLRDLIPVEADFHARVMRAAGREPLVIPQPIYPTVVAEPFRGRTLNEWLRGVRGGDAVRVASEIRALFGEGAGRAAATERLWTSGTNVVVANQLRAVVGTAVPHVASIVTDLSFPGSIALRWTAVLDNRTSLICSSRDGLLSPLRGDRLPPEFRDLPLLDPPRARPPAHPWCRSIMVPVFSRRDYLKGPIPFRAWFSQQPAWVHDRLLGSTRGKLYRTGKIDLDRFTDRSNRRYTLDELRESYAEAFELSGL